MKRSLKGLLAGLSLASIGGVGLPAFGAGTAGGGTISDVSATASLTGSGQAATIAPSAGTGTLVITATGTWTGTLNFEGRIDGTNYVAISCLPLAGGGTTATSSSTANGSWVGVASGYTSIRVRESGSPTGTAVVTVRSSLAGSVQWSPQLPVALGQTTMAGSLPVTLASNQGTVNVTDTKLPAAAAVASGTAAPTTTIVAAIPHLLNTAGTYDPATGNIDGTALASAARTSTTSSADLVNENCRGAIAYLNVTAASGTGGLQIQLQVKDPVSGSYVSINAAPTAVTATGIKAYVWYPGHATGSGYQQTNQEAVPRVFRFTVGAGDSSSYTYSVGYSLIN